jgi:hypothetical protein
VQPQGEGHYKLLRQLSNAVSTGCAAARTARCLLCLQHAPGCCCRWATYLPGHLKAFIVPVLLWLTLVDMSIRSGDGHPASRAAYGSSGWLATCPACSLETLFQRAFVPAGYTFVDTVSEQVLCM